MSSWKTHLDYLISPVLLEESGVEINGDTLTLRFLAHGAHPVTVNYHRRISSWQVVVNVTVILFADEPARRREARVAYNVEADKLFRDFWMAAEEKVSHNRTVKHNRDIQGAVEVIKNFLKSATA